MTVNGYLFAAYTAIWTILFVYLFFLNRRQRQVGRELQQVAESLDRRRSSD